MEQCIHVARALTELTVCARRRALTGLGWMVISVPCYEYYELDTIPKKVRAGSSLGHYRLMFPWCAACAQCARPSMRCRGWLPDGPGCAKCIALVLSPRAGKRPARSLMY